MYEEFFGLKEPPFNITADPDFFFQSKRHSEAFSNLMYGIQQRKGILVITGEIGTGKTTLCRTLLNHLDNDVKTALILNPSFSPTQLLQLIIKDFGIEGHFSNKYDLIEALNEFLLEETGMGNNIVLIIDESQNLGVNQLEQVRLLSNLETEKQKLLQIILVGQPELIDKLKLNELRQVNQRVAVRYHIMPLDEEDVKKYIEHRINVAKKDPDLETVEFTKNAISAIYHTSGGSPRSINIVCDRILLAAFTTETKLINAEIVHRCSQEVGKR